MIRADLGFYRGGEGADFQKKIRKFCRPFFLGRPNRFSELCLRPKRPCMARFSAPQANFLKTQAKETFLGFLGVFRRALPSQN